MLPSSCTMTHIPSQGLTCSSQEERGRKGKQIYHMSLTQIRSVYRQEPSFCFFLTFPVLSPSVLCNSQWKVFPAEAITALNTHLVNLSVSRVDGMHPLQWQVIISNSAALSLN